MLKALRRGMDVLGHGGAALDAVIACVTAMEDDPLFNAGYGSALNTDGEVEMDASVMVSGTGMPAGGVACVNFVRNPILLARAVMERTPHLLMTGLGAEHLAAAAGIRLCLPAELKTERAIERLQRFLERAANSPVSRHGTVGAVALDHGGRLAAATSTGGMTGKMPGRVGDSAIVGAGTWADAHAAASATGVGEAIIRAALCREAAAAARRRGASTSARAAIADLAKSTGSEAGIIMVDRRAGIGYAHNAASMDVAFFNGSRTVYLRPKTLN